MKHIFFITLFAIGFCQISTAQNIPHANIVGPYGVQVNSYNGNLFFERIALEIPNADLGIMVKFAYNSFRDTVQTGYGKGFVLNYGMNYELDSTGTNYYLQRADGRRDYFTFSDGNFTAPNGIFDRWEAYDGDKFFLTTKYDWKYYFENATHRKLTKIEDTNNNTINLNYNANGELIQIEDPSGRFISLNWTDGLLTTIVDNNLGVARTWSFVYDADGHLLEATNPIGGQVIYSYEGSSLVQVLNERADFLDIKYDNFSKVSHLESCLTKLVIKYAPNQKTSFVVEKNTTGDRMTTFVYDEEGQLQSRVGSCCGFSTSYAYDVDQNIKTLTDGEGNTYQVNHDEQGNVLQVIDPASNQQSLSFEGLNRLTSWTDKRGNTTTMQYDSEGNLLTYQQPGGIDFNLTYDDQGNVTSLSDGNEEVSSLSYNDNNDITEINYPDGNVKELFIYDELGNLMEADYGEGIKNYFEYDALNRLKKARDNLNNEFNFEYDAASNLIKETSANGHEMIYDYDASHRLTQASLGSISASYEYDPSNNLTAIVDGNGNQRSFIYNSRSLLTEEKDAIGNRTQYSYSPNGNMVSKVDANGKVTNYQYDALNRLTQRSYEGNTDTYDYDANGNLVYCANNDLVLSYTYDEYNRETSKTILNWGILISYEYDAAGNRTKMTDPTGITLYTYNANSQLIEIKNPDNEVTKFVYDNANRLVRQEQHNGTTINYSYDTGSRIIALENKRSDGSAIANYQYEYDGNGNRITTTETDGTVWSYAYDENNQLLSVQKNSVLNQTFSYDGAGNRIAGNGVNYLYDAADRLASISGGATYLFDENGNLIQEMDGSNQTQYEYDGDNRLVSITLPDATLVTYQYDPFGNRISKVVGNEVTRYVLDGENTLLELNGNNDIEARYTTALGVDSWISMKRNQASYFYHIDGLGSIISLTNAVGGIENTYAYDAFGNFESVEENVKNTISFTGREWDTESELYYYRTRYYNAAIGRFQTKDDFEGFYDRPLSLNPYLYVENNPQTYIDPSGEFILQIRAIIAVGKGLYKLYRFSFKHISLAGKFIKRNLLKALARSKFYRKYKTNQLYRILRKIGRVCRAQLRKIERLKPGNIGEKLAGKKHEYDYKSVKFLIEQIMESLDDEEGEDDHLTKKLFYKTACGKLVKELEDAAKGLQDLLDDSDDDDNDTPPGSDEPIITIPIIRSVDPNEIIAPVGYDIQKWVAKSATLPYTILFENDPEFATAAAQRVVIEHKFDADLNRFSFRLGDFGFGDYYFSVPEDLSYYNTQIDLSDSLGVLLQVTAGLNAADSTAFWIFESRDPLTGQATTLPADAGFLPVNDTISRVGEGFVNFTIRPSNAAETGDVIHAQASIIFDDNAAIETNVDFNTIDADAPESFLHTNEQTNNMYELAWSGTDEVNSIAGSGVASYALYGSVNNGPFLPLANNLQDTSYTYIGVADSSYCFFVRSKDFVANQEAIKMACEPNCMSVFVVENIPASGGLSNGSLELEVTGESGTLLYEWSHDLALNSNAATGLAEGTYTVTVSDAAGCVVMASFEVESINSTNGLDGQSFFHRIYPVPTDASLKLEFTLSSASAILEVYDLLGQRLLRKPIRALPGQLQVQELDVSFLAAGNYIIKLTERSQTVSGMFTKQ
ncbi:MAG: RHS repeat-associated core domain-containing protein [Saprospiraceae bacterium]